MDRQSSPSLESHSGRNDHDAPFRGSMIEAALKPHLVELDLLSAHRCNVLLEGSVPITDAVLERLRPHVRHPMAWHHADASLEIPAGTRTLVVKDVSTLSPKAQRRLHAWIDGAHPRLQIIATTDRPLFHRVAEALFDAGLYYRLNVFLLRIGTEAPALRGVSGDQQLAE